MYKVLIKSGLGTWVEIRSGYNKEDIESFAVTQLNGVEYMVVCVIRHHSGGPEVFEIEG